MYKYKWPVLNLLYTFLQLKTVIYSRVLMIDCVVCCSCLLLFVCCCLFVVVVVVVVAA